MIMLLFLFINAVIEAKKFMRTEESIGLEWDKMAEDSWASAHQAEIDIAKEKNHYHQGLPWIRVIIDCGWSKRSLGHSYNAKSGAVLTLTLISLFGQYVVHILNLLFTRSYHISKIVLIAN